MAVPKGRATLGSTAAGASAAGAAHSAATTDPYAAWAEYYKQYPGYYENLMKAYGGQAGFAAAASAYYSQLYGAGGAGANVAASSAFGAPSSYDPSMRPASAEHFGTAEAAASRSRRYSRSHSSNSSGSERSASRSEDDRSSRSRSRSSSRSRSRSPARSRTPSRERRDRRRGRDRARSRSPSRSRSPPRHDRRQPYDSYVPGSNSERRTAQQQMGYPAAYPADYASHEYYRTHGLAYGAPLMPPPMAAPGAQFPPSSTDTYRPEQDRGRGSAHRTVRSYNARTVERR